MHHLFLMCIVVQFHMEILWNNSGFSHEVINLFVYQDIVIFIAIAWNECIISPEMRLWFEELFSLGGKYNVRISCGCVGVFLVKQKNNKTKQKNMQMCVFSLTVHPVKEKISFPQLSFCHIHPNTKTV